MIKKDLPGYIFFQQCVPQFIAKHTEKCGAIEKQFLKNVTVLNPVRVVVKNRTAQQVSLFHPKMEVEGIWRNGIEGYIRVYLGYSYRDRNEHIILFAGFPGRDMTLAPDLEIVFSNKKGTLDVYRKEMQMETGDLYARELAQFLRQVSLYLQDKVRNFAPEIPTAQKPSGQKISDVSPSSQRSMPSNRQQIWQAIAATQNEVRKKMRFSFSLGDFAIALHEVCIDMADSVIRPSEFFSGERKARKLLFRIFRPVFWIQVKGPKKIQKWIGRTETRINKGKEWPVEENTE